MWSANFEDGTSVSSKNLYWTDIKRFYETVPSKQMTGVILFHPNFPNLRTSLSGMSLYFFYTEAVALFQGNKPIGSHDLAEVIGGVKDGTVYEKRLDYRKGELFERSYPLAECQITKDVMYKGK